MDDLGMEQPARPQQPVDGNPSSRIEIVAYDPTWPERFAELGHQLRGALGEVARRIDHIGSTSVPGLGAKPIIDIQVSAASFEPLEAFKQPLERLGIRCTVRQHRAHQRYFREPPGRRRTRIHVRRAGSFSEQWALLFHDHLRAHPAAAAEYEAVKRHLALELGDDRHGYTDAKVPFM
jgi:GrpB-like predicted nucleotidyltransferase (UPF0157 family)